jgi:hypothetical protein
MNRLIGLQRRKTPGQYAVLGALVGTTTLHIDGYVLTLARTPS